MLSLNPPKPFLSNQQPPYPSSFFTRHLLSLRPRTTTTPRSTLTPSNPQKQQQQQQQQQLNQQQHVYQPFRPPPSPLPPKFRSLDTTEQLETLSNRLGLWFEYAPLIPSLIQQGFSHSSIEQITGISGVEQNHLIVAAQVRDSLLQSDDTHSLLSFFDSGGADLLYEIRLLSASQRASAAQFIVHNRLDARAAQDLARAMKDFPRRRADPGWDSFSYPVPGDCLAFMYFRQSREHPNPSEPRASALQRALEVAETENAKKRILEELNGKPEEDVEAAEAVPVPVKVPVVRMKVGEVAEATAVVVLPVCDAEEGVKAVAEAPEECRSEGEFGVVVAEKGWRKWVVMPMWAPLFGSRKGMVVVAFEDASVLPWKVNRRYEEERILVVVDREKREVGDGYYVVGGGSKEEGSGFKVERGERLKELGVEECLGTVVLVVRPPKELEDQLADEDWD